MSGFPPRERSRGWRQPGRFGGKPATAPLARAHARLPLSKRPFTGAYSRDGLPPLVDTWTRGGLWTARRKPSAAAFRLETVAFRQGKTYEEFREAVKAASIRARRAPDPFRHTSLPFREWRKQVLASP